MVVTPDGSKVYVANRATNTVSVIATATNTVVGSPITVGTNPVGVAVTPDGSKVYVANFGSNTVSVIDTATNTVVGSPITVGSNPEGVAVTPDGSKVYVANQNGGTVSVIATATNTVVGSPITDFGAPVGVAVTPDGSKVYVANHGFNTVSVIATATNTVVGSPITVGNGPTAFGLFIQPVSVSSFKITIPAGSFVNAGLPGYSTFVGVINGVSLNVLIKQTSGNNYIFGVIAKNVSLTINNPVTVTLTIGGDSGTTSVTAVIINTG